jgi:leucyl/phenylalanyl-tRNA--protein transferase
MRAAYHRLHRLGHAHSVETWIEEQLAGGLYGVAIGAMFYGESMFSRTRDASKIALAHLARRLHTAGFGLIDCQMRTDHLASLGAREIPRARFQHLVGELVDYAGRPGPWTDWGTAAEKTPEPCRS